MFSVQSLLATLAIASQRLFEWDLKPLPHSTLFQQSELAPEGPPDPLQCSAAL